MFPERSRHGLELGRAHVVVRAPHLANIGIAELGCTFVGELNKAHVLVAHRNGNIAPARPEFEQFVVVTPVCQLLFEIRSVKAVAVVTAVLARVIDAL